MTGTIITVKNTDLRNGDILPSGSVIVGYDRLGRGGAHYTIRRPDGTTQLIALDGRRRYTIERPATEGT